ncbi:MAG: hypothetical protein ACRD43_11795 [Pyrinomonadaceae bacterium]
MTDELKQEEHPIKPCPVCMAPNDIDAPFCVECGSPFGTDSALYPGEVIRPEGPYWRWPLGPHARRRGFRLQPVRWIRPRLSYVCLVWALNFPVVVVALIGCTIELQDATSIQTWVFFWLLLILGFGAGKLLYESLHDYLTLPDRQSLREERRNR